MKKVLTLFFVIAILVVGMAPAMANPSIGTLTVVGDVEILRDEAHPLSDWIAELLDAGWYAIIREAHPETYANPEVAKEIEAINSSDTVETMEATLNNVKDFQPAEGGVTASDLAGYDYVTQFVELVLTNGTEYRFTEAGDEMTARAKLKSDALRGESPENMDRYQTMLINPNSGEIFTNPLQADAFDSDEGTVDAEFNAMGAFALIEK